MKTSMSGFAAAAILAASALSSHAALASPEGKPRPLIGSFGGSGAGVEAAEGSTQLTFDCATGSVEGPITLDENGGFDVAGRLVREGPGPVRPEQTKGVPARFAGKLDGETMTLSVRVSGSDDTLGPFTLTRGRLARIRSCG
jgi:hypothetical protein